MSWIGRFFLGRKKIEPEPVVVNVAEDDGILKGDIIGGTITPVITPVEKISTHILSAKKLNNRLRILTEHIPVLKKRGASPEMIAHFEERREKVKAMLWIYFDETD